MSERERIRTSEWPDETSPRPSLRRDAIRLQRAMRAFRYSGPEIADENGKVEASDYDLALAYVRRLERELADCTYAAGAIVLAAGGEVRVKLRHMVGERIELTVSDGDDPMTVERVYRARVREWLSE